MGTRNKVLLGLTISFLGILFPGFSSDAGILSYLEDRSQRLVYETNRETVRSSIRLAHAKELLGHSYRRSTASAGENIPTLDALVNQWVSESLFEKWKGRSKEISKTILAESDRYRFDPIFLLAIIKNESSFNPDAVGTSGEIGLMQILPQTAEWICKKNGIRWTGAKSLKDPSTNIRIGAAYLSYLRTEFKAKSQLYLAAYNMGSGNVRKAIGRQHLPLIYTSKVMKFYLKYYGKIQEDLKKNL